MATPTLSRIHSVREHLGDTLSAHPNELVALFSRFVNQGKGMLLPHQLLAEYEAIIPEVDREKLKDGVFEDVLKAAQEAIVLPPWVALAIDPRPGVWEYVRVNVSELAVEELTVPEYLQFKEELVDGSSQNNFVLEFGLRALQCFFPSFPEHHRPTTTTAAFPDPHQPAWKNRRLWLSMGRRKALYLCCLQTGRKEEVYLKKEEACGKKNGLWLSTGRRRKKRACGS